MADRIVATRTGQAHAVLMNSFDGDDHGLMTGATGAFGDVPVVCLDLNGFMEPPGGKAKGMPETVGGFGDVLGHETCWGMAIIANGNRPVTRPDPAVILVVHNVTIGARSRIIREV